MMLYIFIALSFAASIGVFSKKINKLSFPPLFLFFGYALFAGSRANVVGVDTQNYIYAFQAYLMHGGVDYEYLFALLMRISAWVTNDSSEFLLLIALVNSVFYILLFRSLASLAPKKNWHLVQITCAALLVCSPFLWVGYTNILRQSLATPFIIISFLALSQKRYFLYVLSAGVAALFHNVGVLFLIVAPVVIFPRRTFHIITVGLVVGYVSSLNQAIVSTFFPFVDVAFGVDLDSYGEKADYRAGVRYDFLAFSLFIYFLAVFFVKWMRFLSVEWERGFKILSDVYLVLLFPFLMIGHIPFSDRLLSPAWVFSALWAGYIINATFSYGVVQFMSVFLILLAPVFVGLMYMG